MSDNGPLERIARLDERVDGLRERVNVHRHELDDQARRLATVERTTATAGEARDRRGILLTRGTALVSCGIALGGFVATVLTLAGVT